MEDKNTQRQAAALKYDPERDAAPIITAVGSGTVAENIIKTAQENAVPVVEDRSTAEILSKFSVGDAIPPSLYEAVAQILIFVAELDAGAGTKDKYRSAARY